MKRSIITYLVLILAIIVTVLLPLVLGGCSEDDAALKPSFTLEGEWKGVNWYCNNSTKCVVAPVDKSAVITFTVKVDNSAIVVSPCKYDLPSCAKPGCTTIDWVVTFADYVQDQLTIKWAHGYTFKGKRQGEKFQGSVTYKYSQGEYVWNDNVELIKK